MKDLFMSGASGGFHPQAFRHDSHNPLLYQSHAYSFAYGDPENFQADRQAGNSSFSGDFKPMMIANGYTGRMAGVPENHVYSKSFGRGVIGNMSFGL